MKMVYSNQNILITEKFHLKQIENLTLETQKKRIFFI